MTKILETELRRVLLKFVQVAIIFWIVEAPVAIAQNLGKEVKSPCQNLLDARAVLDCALTHHPKVRIAVNALAQAKARISWAGQIPNPELSGTGTFGQSLGDVIIDSQVSLLQPIYIGGLISSKKREASALAEVSNSDLLSFKEQAAVATVSNLYRLGQIRSELDIAEETVSTFDKILKQFRTRVKLSPEQRASVNVFELVKSDFILRKSSILQERTALGQFFKVVTGADLERVEKLSPSEVRWPNAEAKEIKNSKIQNAKARAGLAYAELDVARSMSWPTLKIGPSMAYSYQGGIQYPSYGVAMSFDLPLFNLNGGHRAYTRAGVLRANTSLEVTHRVLSERKKQVLTQYKVLRKALKKASSMELLKRKHVRLEKLFVQGLITPTLVIEAHRQMLDYAVNRHRQEIEARKLLWATYILRGSFEKEQP